jgi:flagellar hook-associated protein 1 FlgK
MAGIIGNLISASQSLTTQTQGVEIASKNIANINTPGYARQRLVLGDKGMIETPLGLQSMGVQALGIEQIRNTFLDSQVIREISKTSSLDAQESALSQAQANLGEPIEGTTGAIDVNTATTSSTGISAAINKFFNAFENFAAKPTDSGAKQQVLQQADAFVNRVNLTDNRLDSLQTDLTKQVSTELKSANDLISQIASLNGQIQTVEISVPNSAVDLRTKRQATLEELAKFLDLKATEVPGQY